ncbi:ACT domain-containing protein [Thermanaerosceptrum fracticalcis]|uniref:ACT domain-containing protein n=1 Tax=Thermanaerosceptrum fracticalcis TaxID=1712410 RepID=A0A7G6DYJ9_THEFR|nr:ACT domain-containing protein [Thermanaerosceptrum fracticalcis]QNB44903.1 ACT domain-containing protein [Thermanaerosceptrum fracticalcis]
MKIKQLTVFLENKVGSLADLTGLLGENDINIRALSIIETSDSGILRMIVNDTEKAYNLLRASGFSVVLTEVIAVEIADTPGGLAKMLSLLKNAGINVEYTYAFIARNIQNAIVIIRVSDAESAERVLKENRITLIERETVDFYW